MEGYHLTTQPTIGYTHYFREQNKQLSKKQKTLANRLFYSLLGVIINPGKGSLRTLWENCRRDPKTFERDFDENFHEYGSSVRGLPILYGESESAFDFCKTARKRYDIAVYAVLKTVYDALGYGFSSDADCIQEEHNVYPSLKEYYESELFASFKYDFELIESICRDFYRALLLTVSDDTSTKIGNLTIEGPVNVDDLRHIATMIEQGSTSSPADGMYKRQPRWFITNL